MATILMFLRGCKMCFASDCSSRPGGVTAVDDISPDNRPFGTIAELSSVRGAYGVHNVRGSYS